MAPVAGLVHFKKLQSDQGGDVKDEGENKYENDSTCVNEVEFLPSQVLYGSEELLSPAS